METKVKKTPVLSTLCHIIKDDCYLMMHRVKKENDINKDKWIGVGGKFEYGESPEECLLREVKEETGLTLLNYKFRGIVTFCYGEDVVEYMHIFDGYEFEGELTDCDEGELVWVPIKEVCDLPIWEGDKIFFKLLAENADFFSLKLVYDTDDTLKEAVVY
ncbi:MAG: 8-oxo-dGTP diphosphatase [Lachnospiraceae bacterium]|nr:8-oxo-dGTP diphosphatase [Lachnospiraceae bacterium]MBR6384263.1 8-oxo-dGTP diphosphatase [Lachnospiraceae bacterium]